MKIIKRVLTDALVLEPKVFEDPRGFFFESFNLQRFREVTGSSINFVQDNHSVSSKGTLRGIHFQIGEFAQSKLVRVTRGSVYDVAVDLRPDSPTYRNWFGVELDAKNKLQLFIPKGFGHAFVALEDDTIFQYKVDNYYSAAHDGGLVWNDEQLSISWPELDLKLSDKDRTLPKLRQLEIKKLWEKK